VTHDAIWRTAKQFNIFWTVVMYISASLSLYDAATTRPQQLRGLKGVVMVCLVVAFFAMHHLLFLRRSWTWPMPTRLAWIYFPAQLVLMVLLSRFSPNFGWLSWALLGQIASVLRPRHWALPMIVPFVMILTLFGLADPLQRGDWFALLTNLFTVAIFIGMFASIYIAFSQRYQLAEAVQELESAKRTLEQQAAQVEELAALRERARLARDMHDNLGHALVVVNVKLEAAQRLYGVEHARGDQELEATRSLVRDTMSELRRSLAGLRAPLHEHQDLQTALARMADEVGASSQLAISCRIADVPALSPDVSEALWRVGREALTNVQRHARATHVRMTLDHAAGAVVLRVEDDGTGIDERAAQRNGHYGIIGMRERVEGVGGTLRIARRAEGGTSVEATIPTIVTGVTAPRGERA
jgi:signal transduction histidine kinase